jgi:citrate lyase beta subunit
MLDPSVAYRLDDALAADDAARARLYPGAAPSRQPVHTVYVPAHRFTASTVAEWGTAALEALDTHGPLPGVSDAIDSRVRTKLTIEPIEDLRIDFEDGYRATTDEDTDVRSAAIALAHTISEGTAPPYTGIRIKSLEPTVRRRGLRTLDLFLHTLLTSADLPSGFRVTLPKVTSVAQVRAMADLCATLDETYDLPGLRFEIQIETPQAILGPDGTALVAPMIHAAAGRCAGLHFGTYDYTTALNIAAPHQSLDHPAADHAKAVMQLAAAETGIPLSDGSTNILPTGTTEAVREAWTFHLNLVHRSLERGFYQGWDLHPAQLPTRYAATHTFYQAHLPQAIARLHAYRTHTTTGVLDEPATARSLARFLLRALHCGATNPLPDLPEPTLIALAT